MFLTLFGGADIVAMRMLPPEATEWGGHLSVALSPSPLFGVTAEVAGWLPFEKASFNFPSIPKNVDYSLRTYSIEFWAPALQIQVVSVFLPITMTIGDWDGGFGLGVGGGATQLVVNSCDSPCEPEPPQWQPSSLLRVETKFETGMIDLRFRGDYQLWISRSHGTWLELTDSLVWGVDVGWKLGRLKQ